MEPNSLLLKLTIFLLFIAHVPLASTRKLRAEGFPSCVEIVDINPPPFSVVKVLEPKAIWFEVTFSKPVFLAKHGAKRIFLSPDDRGPASKNLPHTLAPIVVQQNTTTGRKWAMKFDFSRKSYNALYGKVYR